MFSFLSSYATIYTMAPVFSLVLDEDVKDEIALRYPELYKDLVKVFLITCTLTLEVGYRTVRSGIKET